MKKALLALAAAALAVAGLAVARAVAGGPPPGHIGICHHTGSSRAHEWIYITPSADGVLNGHGQVNHQFEEDIIPPFVLVKPTGTVSFPGLNLDERIGVNLEPDPNGPYTGAEILAGNCVAPAPTTTTETTPGTTSTGSTTVTTPGTTTTVTLPTTTTVTVTTGTTTTVTVPGKPKPPQACVKLSVKPHQLFVGQPTELTIIVTRAKHKTAGIRVRIRGPHLAAVTKRSNHAGIIRRHVLMKSPGIVRFSPIAAHSCGVKRVGVTGVFTPPVTG